MKVRIVQVPVQFLNVSHMENVYDQYAVESWGAEFVVVDAGEMRLADAQRHLREGTVFEVVETPLHMTSGTVGDWIAHGIDRGFIVEPTCYFHDIIPMTDDEERDFEEMGEPDHCIFVFRIKDT